MASRGQGHLVSLTPEVRLWAQEGRGQEVRSSRATPWPSHSVPPQGWHTEDALGMSEE